MDKSGEPGTARYGNFINYYQFNPADRRIKLIPQDFLSNCCNIKENEKVTMLDIGCNTGELTSELYEHIKENTELHIIGIDVDEVLIERAKEKNRHNKNIKFGTVDIMKDTDSREAYLNTYLQSQNAKHFDIISCFSVTMWLHVNNGDEKFRTFLNYISTLGRYIIIEPQPWKCYKSARRRMKKNDCEPFELFDSLKWRENVDKDIDNYLQDGCGLTLIKQLGTTDWDRCINVYRTPISPK